MNSTLSEQHSVRLPRSKLTRVLVTRIYYQFDVKRLSACPVTIHALLHVVDDIRMNGPPCNNWSFVMERYCGILVPAVKSRSHPFTALSLRQLHITRLNDIKNRYNLQESLHELPRSDGPSSHELVHQDSDCESVSRFHETAYSH